MHESYCQSMRGGAHAHLKRNVLLTLTIFAVALLALFGVQNFANADEGSSEVSNVSISWGTFDTSSLTANANTQADSTARVAMYRLYNKNTGEHFYTSNTTEQKNLVKAGWSDEGIEWYAPSGKTNTPVYRLYNKWVTGGDHHYTTKKSEYDSLEKQGWTKEGIGWYSTAEKETDSVPLYRQYNPFATTGTHNYTKSKTENDKLVKLGWKAEGSGWYGYASATPSIQQIDFTKAKVDTAAKTYTSKQIKPTASVTGLKAGTDYTVTYGTNKNAGTNVGTITIKGINKYTGTKTYKFTIAKAKVTVSWGKTNFTYNTKPQSPSVELKGVLGTDKVTATVGGAKTNAGENYVATASINNSNYQLTGATTTRFTIAKVPLQLTWGDKATFSYNGESQKPEATYDDTAILGTDEVNLTISGAQKNASDTPYEATASIDNDNYQLTGDLTRQFTISKIDPSIATQTDLTAITGDTLAKVKLPANQKDDKDAGTTAGSWEWVDLNKSVGDSTATGLEFAAKFVPSDQINYNTITMNLKVNVKLSAPKATFVANSPSGVTAKVDGEDEETITLTADSGTDLDHTFTADSFPTEVKITSEDTQNWIFAGWSTNKDAKVAKGISEDQMVGTEKFTGTQTYYAIWMQTSGYWMGTKDAGEEYVNEAYFATHDSNYIPASTIKTDMDVMHNQTAAYTSTKSRWNNYYTQDIRLYVTYAYGDQDPSYDASSAHHDQGPTSAKNKYMECRILEVSQTATGHDSDGSAVTFMATHLLPTAYALRDDVSNNVGGWEATTLKTKMNSGEIFNKFPSDFTSQVKQITKKYGTGNATANTETGSYKFWLLSMSELVGTNPISDGTQYAFFSNAGIKYSNNKYAILANMKTRGAMTPGSASDDLGLWWLRSPSSGFEIPFSYVRADGYVSDGTSIYTPTSARGVAPAFSF